VYVIQRDIEPFYWSNTDGWVDRESATVFTPRERDIVGLPLDGYWERTGGTEAGHLLAELVKHAPYGLLLTPYRKALDAARDYLAYLGDKA
jgi:hypothetical protein